MDSPDSRASGGERRLSTRRSMSLASRGNDSHSDESYDMAELSVADGFRPTNVSTSNPTLTPPQISLQPATSFSIRSPSPSPSHASASSSRPQDTLQAPRAAPIARYPTENAPRSRPSSISKAHRPHGSLTLRNEGTSNDAISQQTRPQLPTLSTGVPLTQTGNGSGELSGPSHPYHAYQQRTMSDTASSTGGQPMEGEYIGPREPTHPYSLYPQSTVPIEDSNGQPIPVGFTGLGGAYHRQIGPDGEESGDLIGPLGHMEALPPYTRYPEQPYPRGTQADVSSPSPTTTASPTRGVTVPPAAHIPGAGGIGIAARNPEYSSTDENLPGAHSARSTDTSDVSQNDTNTAPKRFTEKLPSGRWQRRARKKFLGVIPYWAICLLVFGLLVVGIVMGVALGILLHDNDQGKPDGDDVTAPQPTVDVEPLPTVPSDLPPLMTGIFDLPPLDVSQAPRSCFSDPSQSQSWSCEMPLRYYTMEVEKIANASKVENFAIQLEAINGSDSVYVWGTQPPSVTEPVPLRLVNDTFEPARGPAWWRQFQYDKTVLVSEASFNNQRKRDWTYTGPIKGAFDPSRFMAGNPGPSDGEKAWICTWPNVTMEIFIYPSQNASLWGQATTTPVPTPTASSGPSETSKAAYDPTPSYPQVVKFLERRLWRDGDMTAAMCRQVRIINDGKDSESVLDDDGNPVEVAVTERVSSYEESLEQSERSRHPDRRSESVSILRRETLELTDCGCLWWST